MDSIVSHTQLLQDCQAAIEDGNLEQCFKLLRARLKPDAAIRQSISHQSGLFRIASKDNENALLSRDDYRREYAQVAHAMLELLPKIQSGDLVEEEGIHERILIFTYKENKSAWEKLFAKREFSHTCIMLYDHDVPEDYKNPEVIIFDDTGPKARPHIERCSDEMPKSHFLYYGRSGQNPFSERRNDRETAIWERTANANTMFTVYARLRELLEFRKIYGAP